MIYLSMQIDESENGWIFYNGEKIQKRDIYNLLGKHKIKFTFISTNSSNEQCIVLSLFDVKCDIYWNEKKYEIPKTKFPTLDISEKQFGKEVILEIELNEGVISIYNGATKKAGKLKIVEYAVWGSAMRIEELSSTKKRYYCNDFENDDDFDDLIFEMEIMD